MDAALVAAVAPVLVAVVGLVGTLAGLRAGERRGRAAERRVAADAASAPASHRVEDARASLTSELARLEVLIVEDDPLAAKGAARLLRSHDVTVAAVGSVGEARAVLGSLPRVLVVDLGLGGQSGEEVLSALPLVVLWSGHDDAREVAARIPGVRVVEKGDAAAFEHAVLAALGRSVE